MTSSQRDDEAHNLQAAISALEAQRSVLGDAVVEAALKPLRAQLAALTSPPDERKRVTILFADVSGFTAMSEKLDPEDVTAMMNRCFERLSSEITHCGGTVDKYSGDAVMALFGAPRALENHEEMAVRAALAMQVALQAFSAELEAEHGLSLRMRIGLNTGEVLAGLVGGLGDKGYTVMGDAVNLASRLEHACPVGRVMISAESARPLHAVFDLEPPQQITVKGKTEPVTVYLVAGAKAERGRVRGLAGLTTAMIGRETELAAVQAAYERSRKRWQAVAIVGEAGIGKTRLRREFLAWLARFYPEARVFTGRCYAHTQATPYHLATELVQALFGIGRDDQAAAILDKLREILKVFAKHPGAQRRGETLRVSEPDELDYRLASLASLLGLSQLLESDPLHSLEPQQRRNRIFLSLERIWMEAAAHSSIVIVVEDLHWADELSMALLERLLEAAGQAQASGQTALLLAVSRPPPDRQSRLGQFLARLGQAPHQVIELQLLDKAQAGRLLSGLLGEGETLKELAALIAARAQGNPFFVEELVRSLIEDGSLAHQGETGGWQVTKAVAGIRVPTTVQGVLAERLDRLSPEEKRLAQRAAIVGRTFWQRLLGEIASQDVEAALASIEARQLIVRLAESHIADDWEWLFRHVLVQEVAYSSITKATRREVHRAVAEWLEAHAGERGEFFVPLIAYHYEQAQAGAKALHYLTLAAGQAAKAFDNHKAVEFSTRALEFVGDDDGARFDLLNTRQEVYGQLGAREAQWADLQDMLELAEGLGDERRRARVLNNIGWTMRIRGDFASALAYHQQALALFRQLGDTVSEGACLTNIGLVRWALGETGEALTQCEQALQLARQVGHQLYEGSNLNNIGTVHWQIGDYSHALGYYRQALLIHQEIKHRYNEGIGHTNIGEVYRQLGKYDQALSELENALSICRAIGDREGELYALHQLGLTHTELRQDDQAIERHHEALRLAREMADRNAEADAMYGLGLAHLEQGCAEAALSRLDEACALHEELGQIEALATDLCALSQAHLALGEVATARECSTQAVGLAANSPLAHYQHYRAELGAGVSVEQARGHLEKARDLLLQQAGRISDEPSRQSFLENVAVHRQIMQESAALRPPPEQP